LDVPNQVRIIRELDSSVHDERVVVRHAALSCYTLAGQLLRRSWCRLRRRCPLRAGRPRTRRKLAPVRPSFHPVGNRQTLIALSFLLRLGGGARQTKSQGTADCPRYRLPNCCVPSPSSPPLSPRCSRLPG